MDFFIYFFFFTDTQYLPGELCPFFSSTEDILDDVSGLTVNSPDESMEEGHRVILQSPGGHLEDKTCMGTGQKVGHCRQRGNFDVAGRRSEFFFLFVFFLM